MLSDFLMLDHLSISRMNPGFISHDIVILKHVAVFNLHQLPQGNWVYNFLL